MNIVITAATAGEWQPIQQAINQLDQTFKHLNRVDFHTSGVGLLVSAFSLTKLFLQQTPSLVIQAGIAGSFNPGIALGNVVIIEGETLGDTGVTEAGEFRDIFDLNLADRNAFPFLNGTLPNPWLSYFQFNEKFVRSVTVNEITTLSERVQQMRNKYLCDIESMEGAALHYTGLQTGIPFIQVRGISNVVGERNKANWKIKPALDGVTQQVLSLLRQLDQNPTMFDGKKIDNNHEHSAKI